MKRLSFAIAVLCVSAVFSSVGWAAPTAVGGACVADAECTLGSICDGGFCSAVRRDTKIVPPFFFRNKGAEGYFDVPQPIFWFQHFIRQKDTQVQFPFFARVEDKQAHESTTVLPFFLFAHTRTPERTTTTLVPFFFWQRGRAKSMFVMPLLLTGTSHDASTGEDWRVIFPLFFDHTSKESHWTLAPLLWLSQTPGHNASVVFPLFWHVKDTVQGYEHMLFIPFFDYESDARGRHVRTASLFGFWEHDDDAGLKQGFLLVPPIFYRKDPQRTVMVVPPLYARWRVHGDGSTGFIAGPFFHSSDPEGSTSGLFPLYWRWHDTNTGATTHWLFPIAGVHTRPGAAGAYVGPVYGWKSTKGWGAGIAPIAFFGRNEHKHHAMVLPLFAHFSDDKAGTSTTAVGPVYVRRAQDGWDAGLLPIFYAGRHGQNSYGALAPLYWHFGQKDGAIDVAGPLYVQRGKDGWRAGLAPLIFLGNKGGHEHEVVFPIFFRFVDHKLDQEKLIAGPFYHQRDGKETLDILFPLMYLRRSPGRGLLITPVAGWQKEADKETLVVGPYIQQTDKRKQSTTRFLFPLGAVHDEPGYHLVVQFPFFWRVHEGDETDTVVFPFYWRVRSPSMQFDGVFPLFLHAKNAVATTTVVGPIWNRTRKDGGRALGLFPVFAYGSNTGGNKEGKTARWFGMPGVFYRDNARFGSGELIVGPFYDVRRSYGYDAGLPGVFFAWRRGNNSFLVTPIFYRQSDRAADSALNVLGPFYWGHNGPEKKVGLFPLLFVKSKPDEASAVLFPLIWVHRKPHGSVGATFLFGWSKYESGWRFYFGPIYARNDKEISTAAIWPLVYFSKNHLDGSSLRMALPFYFDERERTGRQLQVMTPLIWRYHSVERTITVGVPFLVDVNSFGESRTTGVLPFFMRNKSYIQDSVSYTFPPLLLFARKRNTGPDPGTDVVWFPLIWRYGGKDSTTIVAPLFFDFKRGESRTTVVVPVFAYWKRADAKRLIVFNMYYKRGINQEEGSWHCYVVPFADFGRPRKHDLEWNILEGLVGYRRDGRKRTLKLFWFFETELQPVPASNLSWFGSTPTSARTEL